MMFSNSPIRHVWSWVPTRLKNWVKVNVLGERVTPVTPLAEAFPSLTVLSRLPAHTATTPLLEQVELWGPASGFRNPTYTSPTASVVEVNGGLFCSTNRVLLGPDRSAFKRTIVAESLSTSIGDAQPSHPHHPFQGDALFSGEFVDIPDTCTAFQFHRRNYYHTLVDALPRLFLLHHVDLHRYDRPVKILVGATNQVERQYVDLLRPQNTEVVCVPEGRLIRTERFLHLSFLSRQSVGFLPPEYLSFFRSKVLPSRPPRKTRRVLVTRQTVGNRRMRNLDVVWSRLAPLGFERHELEALSPREQVALFYDAEVVVSTHGAALANLLFARLGARVVELFPHPYFIPTYYLLSRSLGLDYRHLCGTQNDRYDDFDVDVESLMQLVTDGEKREQEDELFRDVALGS